MRRRFLLPLVTALASVCVWAVSIPFAQEAPFTQAASVDQGQGYSTYAIPTPSQTFLTAAAYQATLDDLVALRFDWLHDPAGLTADASNEPTPSPAPDPTARSTHRPQLSTPGPQADPTDTPDPTARPTPRATATPEPTPKPTPKPTRAPTPDPTATPPPTPDPTPKPTQPPADYSGRSHFWYPAIGVDHGWQWYGCDYGGNPSGPGAGIYRWGCGPNSNIYLLGHAWSTFKKLREGFHSGALQVGGKAWYSNAQGDVSQWRVKWIRRVTGAYLNATAGDWALNDSPTPIMTLQTCDGSQSQYRIIVRLVPAG